MTDQGKVTLIVGFVGLVTFAPVDANDSYPGQTGTGI